MHCQLLLRVMRHHGLGILLDDPLHGNHLKKVLLQSVLATDMGIHADFMLRLKQVADGELGPLCMRQIIMCQAILKNADISNPVSSSYQFRLGVTNTKSISDSTIPGFKALGKGSDARMDSPSASRRRVQFAADRHVL